MAFLISGEWFFSLSDVVVTTREKEFNHKNCQNIFNKQKFLYLEDEWQDSLIPEWKAETIAVYSEFFESNLHRFDIFKNAKTFILHNSDQVYNTELVCEWLDNHSNITLYAQNLTFYHPRAFVLPIGQANSMWKHGDSFPWSKPNNYIKDIEILKTYYEPTNSVRTQLNSLKDSRIQTLHKCEYKEYVAALQRSEFVICPEGNGPDTHRLWETLYAGAIPIVLQTPFIEQLQRCYPEIPLIVVENFSSIPQNLKYEFPSSLQVLNKDFWTSKIKNLLNLEYVVTATNDNSLYCDFIPIFTKAWKKLVPGVKIKIVYIGKEIPERFSEYTEFLELFNPEEYGLENISTAFISQYIRSLYPAIIDCEGGVLITDMDILPMNAGYYTQSIKNIKNNKFVYYRDVLLHTDNQIAMCYNIATPKNWQEIFNIKNLEDIVTHLKNINSKIIYTETYGGNGWFTDQLELYKYVMEWNRKTGNFVYLKDSETGFRRFDRIHLENISTINNSLQTMIKNHLFSDYHALRPYSKYKKFNDEVIDLL